MALVPCWRLSLWALPSTWSGDCSALVVVSLPSQCCLKFSPRAAPPTLIAAVAIGTAQAAILLSSVAAASAHSAAGSIDGPILRAWVPAIIAGALFGLGLAPIIPASLSVAAIAAVAVMLNVQIMAGARGVLTSALPAPPLRWLPPAAIGTLSAGLGIGAGTLWGLRGPCEIPAEGRSLRRRPHV